MGVLTENGRAVAFPRGGLWGQGDAGVLWAFPVNCLQGVLKTHSCVCGASAACCDPLNLSSHWALNLAFIILYSCY